jgi:hypothetical protein
MDKLTRYREIVTKFIRDCTNIKISHGEIDTYPVIDPVGDHYLAVNVGWDRGRRVQGVFLHLDIINEKIWVQFNGTDERVASELVNAGVSKDDIVLGEKPVSLRPLTGYAVG